MPEIVSGKSIHTMLTITCPGNPIRCGTLKGVLEMAIFRRNKKQPDQDLSTVLSQRNDLTAEEFPEGPYGASLSTETLGKSTPWRVDQRSPNSYMYENRQLHAGLERNYPADHDIHDWVEDENS